MRAKIEVNEELTHEEVLNKLLIKLNIRYYL